MFRKVCNLGFFVVFLFFSTTFLAVDTLDKIANDPLLKEGLKYSYNSEYDKAIEKFDECIKNSDDLALPCLLRKSLALQRKQTAEAHKLNEELELLQVKDRAKKLDDLNKQNEKIYLEFLSLVDDGISKSENKIAKSTNKKERDFYLYILAYFHGLKGLYEKSNGHPNDAIVDGVRSYRLATQSSYPDARCIVGLAMYELDNELNKMGLIKRLAVKVLVKEAGISHDREKGIEFIEAASQNNGPFVDDVWFVIFKIRTDEKNAGMYSNEQREQIFAYLYSKYPNNETLKKFRSRH